MEKVLGDCWMERKHDAIVDGISVVKDDKIPTKVHSVINILTSKSVNGLIPLFDCVKSKRCECGCESLLHFYKFQ